VVYFETAHSVSVIPILIAWTRDTTVGDKIQRVGNGRVTCLVHDSFHERFETRNVPSWHARGA